MSLTNVSMYLSHREENLSLKPEFPGRVQSSCCLDLEATTGYLRYRHLRCLSRLPQVPRQTLAGCGPCSLAALRKGRTAPFQAPAPPLFLCFSRRVGGRVGGGESDQITLRSLTWLRTRNGTGFSKHACCENCHEMHPIPQALVSRGSEGTLF